MIEDSRHTYMSLSLRETVLAYPIAATLMPTYPHPDPSSKALITSIQYNIENINKPLRRAESATDLTVTAVTVTPSRYDITRVEE
jgi:hypothetical protein